MEAVTAHTMVMCQTLHEQPDLTITSSNSAKTPEWVINMSNYMRLTVLEHHTVEEILYIAYYRPSLHNTHCKSVNLHLFTHVLLSNLLWHVLDWWVCYQVFMYLHRQFHCWQILISDCPRFLWSKVENINIKILSTLIITDKMLTVLLKLYTAKALQVMYYDKYQCWDYIITN